MTFCKVYGAIVTLWMLILLILLVGVGTEKNALSEKLDNNMRSSSLWEDMYRNEREKSKWQEELLESGNDLTRAMRKIGSRAYDRENYNCYDHSKDLQRELEKYDIESSILVSEGRTHAWVAVWVEANTGQFMSTEHPYSILEMRDRDKRVVCN